MAPKPQPWYAAYNQPPRSPKHGRNWKPTAPTHGDPTNRTSGHTAIRTKLPKTQWRTLNTAAFPVSAGVDPGGVADQITFYQFSTIYRWEEPKPEPLPYVGVRAGEIISHRMWYVLDNSRLCSCAHKFIWEPGATIEGKLDEIVANMFYKQVWGGVYSYTTPDFIFPELVEARDATFPVSAFFDYFYPTSVFGIAIGTIKCWGEVIEHEKGWRAQYAKLTSIDEVIGAVNINELRRKYNV